MFSVVRGNVLGAVIAPRGTEDLPADRRPFVWRTFIRPLLDEVAEGQEFPAEDAKAVSRELIQYCLAHGLAVPLDESDRPPS